MIKKYIFAGLVILLPIAITVAIIVFVLDMLTNPFAGAVEELLKSISQNVINIDAHKHILVFLSRIIVFCCLFLLVILLGFLGRRFFFRFLLKQMHTIFSKIPFVKSIYRITRDVVKNFFNENKKPFKESVIVPFPDDGMHVLGFNTGTPPPEITSINEDLQSIFIPTAPHPISGYVVIYSKKDIKTIDIKTEDVFKLLISCGLYEPKKANKNDDLFDDNESNTAKDEKKPEDS